MQEWLNLSETNGEYEKVIELNDTALKIIEGLRSTLPGDEFEATYMAKERYVYEDIIDFLATLQKRTGQRDTTSWLSVMPNKVYHVVC